MRYLIILLLVSGCMASKPGMPSMTRIEFDAPDSYPEGIAYDKTADVYYVSSVRDGTIGKVTRQGMYSVLHADSTLKSTYGIKVHPDGKRLFACVGDANYSRYSSSSTKRKMIRLISIDLSTGKRLSDIDLSKLIPEKHFGNDIAFDDKGNIYITDSFAHAIYKVTENGTASVFAKDKQFETAGVGLNGIVYHPGGFLLTANSTKGKLFKVDINQPKNVQMVGTEQYFMGADGLVLNDNNTLTMVVNGGTNKIFQLMTQDNWQTAKIKATTLAADSFGYPSTATMSGNEIWVMNAKFNELADSTTMPAKKFTFQLADFRPVPNK